MTTATLTSGGTTAKKAAPPSLLTRPLLLRFVSVIGASLSFYLPLSVMPMYAKSSGTDTGAGLVTGALLVTTVAVELATPRLLAGPATACRWAPACSCSGRPRWPCSCRPIRPWSSG